MATNKRLSASIVIGGSISSSLGAAFGKVSKSISGVGKTVTALESKQKLLTRGIRDLGKAGMNIDGLRAKYASVTTQLEKARRAQDRYNTSLERAKNIGGFVKGVGLGVGAAAAAGGVVARPLIGAAIKRENVVNLIRNSGVSKEDGDAMIAASEGSKQFGVSITKATETVSELRTALGDAHHAIEALPTALKAISGLQMYDRLHHTDLASGDSAYQIAKVSEERGGASGPEAMRAKYNWAFKALTGSNGKVSVADLLTSVRSGKGAVQAMSDEAFFGDTFLQQSMGADRYGTSSSTLVNAWIGGHQTHGAFDNMMKLGLLNPSGVQFDKNGRVKKVEPDALVDSQTFLKDPQKWVDEHLIPLAKRRHVDLSDPAQIMAFANAIASNPNAANMILSRMRFDSNIWKDRRNVLQAHDAEQSDKANQQSTAGKEENIRARLEDAQTRMGAVLLPVFVSAMEKTATALEAVNRFAEQSPTAFKAATFAFVGLTAAVSGLAVVGGVSKLATAGLTSAITLLSGSLDTTAASAGKASTGLMGFLGKLGLVGVLSTAALAAAKAAGLPDVDPKQGVADVKNGRWWAASAHLNPLDLARAGAAHFGGKSNADIAASLAAGENPAASKPAPPALPAPAKVAASAVTNNFTSTFSITQLPGQDENALADAVVKRMQQQQAKQSRSLMFDGAGQ